MCTVAASTTFPEPFITPTDRRRLGWVHKSLAGSRCSDHVALLQVDNSIVTTIIPINRLFRDDSGNIITILI